MTTDIKEPPEPREILKYINATPVLQSLLYDIDLMPEQLKPDSRDYIKMLNIGLHFMRAQSAKLSAQTAVKTEQPSLSDARIKEIAETLPHGPNQDHPSWGCNYYRKDASGKYIPEVPDNLIPFAHALLSTQDFTYDQLEQKVVDILAENEQLSHSNKILQKLLSTQRQDSTDAERYRWIRSGEHNGYRLDGRSGIGNFEVIQKVRDGEAYFLHEDRLDKAIDIAIANGAPK